MQVVEDKLAQMLAQNPQRMDYYKKYQEIVADYNKEKDRVTIEETFARLVDLAKSLDEEQKRAVTGGQGDAQPVSGALCGHPDRFYRLCGGGDTALALCQHTARA